MAVRNAKLKQVRKVIETLLRNNGLVGSVVMYDGDVRIAEVFSVLDAKFSKLRLEPAEGGVVLRLKSKAEDYKGDREAQRLDLETTANMVSIMGDLLADQTTLFIHAAHIINDATGAHHTPVEPFDPKQEH